MRRPYLLRPGQSFQCAGAIAAVLAIGGCERPPTSVQATAEAPTDTPEAHLKKVMRRLEFMLRQARPAAGSGIISERSCTYEMQQPTKDGDAYTANVTIEKSVELASSNTVVPDEPADADAEGEPAQPSHPVPVSTTPETAAAIANVEQQVYKLVYKGQRWELVEPPLDTLPETEKICFQYALSDG